MRTRSLGGPLWDAASVIAEHTPDDRDRVVDLLRAASISVVVVGHVAMAIVVWEGGSPRLANTLGHVPVLQWLTWLLQVMPVFFFAGGIASGISYVRAHERGVPWRIWVYGRLTRLIRPTSIYLAIWVPLVLIGTWLQSAKVMDPLAVLSTQLLWFLGVYLPATALTPLLVRAAKSRPLVAPFVMLLVVSLIDLVRFAGGVHQAGLVNFLLVWVMAAQLGLSMRTAKPSRMTLWAMFGGGIALNLALHFFGPYPVSMVGLPGEKVDNMSPPTLMLALHCWVLSALVMLAWEPLSRWAKRTRVWTYTVAVGGSAMTLYLWHLTALVGVILIEHALSLNPGEDTGSLRFWLLLIVQLTITIPLAWVLTTVFSPFENRPLPWLDSPPPPTRHQALGLSIVEGVGVTMCAVAFLVLAATGMGGFPFSRVTHYLSIPLAPGAGFILLGLGVLLARSASAPAS